MSKNTYRSHHCSEINEKLEGAEVKICGWVHKVRDHGGVFFFDLRDRSGLCQIVFPESSKDHEKLRAEFVVSVTGIAKRRPDGMGNSQMASGQMEVEVKSIEVISEAETPPFPINTQEDTASENTRLKYRYLDLRKPHLQKIFKLRHEALQASRAYFTQKDFYEIETPILYKSTPEGARDYLVPSRVYPGSFFALPQSPQTLKQLLMVSGFERYFQIARCFRDEDNRADRQPEFTQLDLEMSFIDQEDILNTMEGFVKHLWKQVLNVDLKDRFPRIAYAEAMSSYGSDKPDLRFGLKISNISSVFEKTEFKVFSTVLSLGGAVTAISINEHEVKELPEWSRKDLDGFNTAVSPFGLRGVAWVRVKDGELSSPIAKFLSDEEKSQLKTSLKIEKNGYALIGAAECPTVFEAMGALRLEIARKLELIQPNSTDNWKFCWVVDFPLYEFNSEDQRLYAAHHPFTQPHKDDMDLFFSSETSDLRKVRANAYDLALNGFELGGGSLRIFDPKVQGKMFANLGLSPDEVTEKFGFFVEALQYGTPPHGGIAFGIDRVIMLMAGTKSIRDVIAFPKTASSLCLMSNTPSRVSADQLAELRISPTK